MDSKYTIIKTTEVSGIVAEFNLLLSKLKASGIMK